jgi:hypothetical protein
MQSQPVLHHFMRQDIAVILADAGKYGDRIPISDLVQQNWNPYPIADFRIRFQDVIPGAVQSSQSPQPIVREY